MLSLMCLEVFLEKRWLFQSVALLIRKGSLEIWRKGYLKDVCLGTCCEERYPTMLRMASVSVNLMAFMLRAHERQWKNQHSLLPTHFSNYGICKSFSVGFELRSLAKMSNFYQSHESPLSKPTFLCATLCSVTHPKNRSLSISGN